MKYPLLLPLVFLLACQSPGEKFPGADTGLKGPYLGQSAPADSALLFAPGLVSNGLNNRDMTISPDGKEIYFCSSLGNSAFNTILVMKEVNGSWSQPEIATFANDPAYKYYEPCIAPDGNKLFFVTDKPAYSGNDNNEDIWVMQRKGDEWGEPVNLGLPVNTDAPEFFPTVTIHGKLYFTRDDKSTGISKIFKSEFIEGKYQTPIEAPPQINAGVTRFNAFIAPDESYCIVPVYGLPDSYGGTDYYITYRNPDNTWTDPLNLGPRINSPSRQEYSPYVSPDGKFFFFMSSHFKRNKLFPDNTTYDLLLDAASQPENGNTDIYWISAGFITELRTGL